MGMLMHMHMGMVVRISLSRALIFSSRPLAESLIIMRDLSQFKNFGYGARAHSHQFYQPCGMGRSEAD
jgi:hypothetical protein